MKDGKRTTEFKAAMVIDLISAVLLVFIGYQLVTQEQADAINQLGLAIAGVVPLIASAYANGKYIDSRTAVKVADIELVKGQAGLPE